MARLDVYLQDDRGSQRVYWIERRQSIVGWFAAPRIFNGLIGAPPKCPLDLHFTYPVDGDYHFSLKDQASSNGDELFENVFSNRVHRKSIVGGVRSKDETPRSDADPAWQLLMPASRPPCLGAYSTQPIVFQFPLSAIPVRHGRVASTALDRLPRLATLPRQSQTVCISELPNGTINICACLLGNGNRLPWLVDEQTPILVAYDDLQFPWIQLYVKFYPE